MLCTHVGSNGWGLTEFEASAIQIRHAPVNAGMIGKAAPADSAYTGIQHHNHRADLKKLASALDSLTQAFEIFLLIRFRCIAVGCSRYSRSVRQRAGRDKHA